MKDSVFTRGKFKIDWVKSFSDLPSKAAITDETGKVVRDISYEMGINIEQTLKASLDELEVTSFTEDLENEFYTEYSVSSPNSSTCYAIAGERVPKTK